MGKPEDTPEKSVGFTVNESDNKAPSTSQRAKRSSSFFHQLSRSFRRSGGERAADVTTIRGTQGAEFEGYGIVKRSETGCCGARKMVEKLLLIKGPFIFVYNSEFDKAPKYAISLLHLETKLSGSSGGFHVALLESALGDVEYRFLFQQEETAKEFVKTAQAEAKVANATEIRKKLGHEKLLRKRSSLQYAEKVAMRKVEDQPEKTTPLTQDVLAAAGPNTIPM
eukprot:Nitzschia sp. Nitz4//scaffold221_size33835//32812//33659//NITZ4_007859-RA/size33835-processed-gene-0.19-mRNA-1//1//CDS//3329542581//1261//frame0